MKRTFALLMIAAVLLCAACSNKPPVVRPSEAPTSSPSAEPTALPTPVATEAPTPEPTPSPRPLPEGVPEGIGEYARECVFRAEDIMDELIDYIANNAIPFESSTHTFVPANKYDELDDEAKAYYDQMLKTATEYGELTLDGNGIEISTALQALHFDHPEIEIYFTMKHTGVTEWNSVIFLPEGRYLQPAEDLDEVRAQVEAFRTVCDYVAMRVPEDFSVIDKYRLLAYYISVVTQYAFVHGEVPNYATCAYGAVINGYSICQGYALGFEYLCRCANLDCRRVRNEFNDENMHFWDIVTLDCGTYYIDVTWCDGSASKYSEYFWSRWFMFTAESNHVSKDGTTTTGKELGFFAR